MKEPAIIIFYKSDTGCGGSDHRPVIGEILDELLSHPFGFIPETAVEGHLAATGLISVVVNPNIQFFKDLNHIHPGIGIDLVDETGYENINNHGSLLITVYSGMNCHPSMPGRVFKISKIWKYHNSVVYYFGNIT